MDTDVSHATEERLQQLETRVSTLEGGSGPETEEPDTDEETETEEETEEETDTETGEI